MAGTQLKEIPIEIIRKVVKADEEAIGFVLKHFAGYIKSLSTRVLRDDYGNEYFFIDEDMRARLEAKLICKIVNGFEILE